LNRVKAFFDQRKLPFLETNKQQAMVPASCLVLENLVGTANDFAPSKTRYSPVNKSFPLE